VFTWKWEERPDDAEMHFTHEFMPNKKDRDEHGWTACFKKLATVLECVS
jgi:hypothetical protein